jgi:predicted adenine nucleotide alpha hydrolase (AANH) superfamily ATPase
MTINTQDNICPRCHVRAKFLETFKKCLYCPKKHCNQCWAELQISDDYKLLIDISPKINPSEVKRICPSCMKMLLQRSLKNSEETNMDDYQLALAISLSQNEANEKMKQKRKLDEEKEIEIPRRNFDEKKSNENLLEKTSEAIERFMNRAKSNCKLQLFR